MYIPELLDLSNHHIHRSVIHNLKCISYQGCWMIMIVCRIDVDLKVGGWVFLVFLVLEKRDLWHFLRFVFIQTTLSLQATPDTPDTYETSYSETDTPLLPDTAVSSFSDSGISWFDKRTISDRRCRFLIASLVSERRSRETGIRFEGCAFTGERSVNFLIRWLPEKSIIGGA